MHDPSLIEIQTRLRDEWLEMDDDELADNVLVVVNAIRVKLNCPTLAEMTPGDHSSTNNPLCFSISEALHAYPTRMIGHAFCMTQDRALAGALHSVRAASEPKEFLMHAEGEPWWDMNLSIPLSLFLARFHHGLYPRLTLAAEAMAA